MLATVQKIGPVLRLFTREHPELRMTDVARALDMPKSSTHALLTTMVDVGLLAVGARGRYRLGWGLLALAEQVRESHDYGEHARPVMQELQRQFRETILLAAPDRDEVVYLERVDGTHPTVRLAGARVGTRVPMHCTATGKALLAHRQVRELAELRRMTRATITDPAALEDELARVRASGIAFDRQEIVADVACLAAPVFDDDGEAVAAVSIAMPAYRFAAVHAEMVEPLKAAAAEITARLREAQARRRASHVPLRQDVLVAAV